jgi:hypothetical protein
MTLRVWRIRPLQSAGSAHPGRGCAVRPGDSSAAKSLVAAAFEGFPATVVSAGCLLSAGRISARSSVSAAPHRQLGEDRSLNGLPGGLGTAMAMQSYRALVHGNA